jgi:hypothetical protein
MRSDPIRVVSPNDEEEESSSSSLTHHSFISLASHPMHALVIDDVIRESCSNSHASNSLSDPTELFGYLVYENTQMTGVGLNHHGIEDDGSSCAAPRSPNTVNTLSHVSHLPLATGTYDYDASRPHLPLATCTYEYDASRL